VTYSIDFRRKVLDTRQREGLSLAKVAKRFGVGLTTVVSWQMRIEPKRTRNKPTTKIDMEALRLDVERNPDTYQRERAIVFGISKTGMYHALRRLGVTFKKNTPPPKDKSGGTTKVSR
jgi:transposase